MIYTQAQNNLRVHNRDDCVKITCVVRTRIVSRTLLNAVRVNRLVVVYLSNTIWKNTRKETTTIIYSQRVMGVDGSLGFMRLCCHLVGSWSLIENGSMLFIQCFHVMMCKQTDTKHNKI